MRTYDGFTLAKVFSPHYEGYRKSAFTLAEILITLGIIGIVAILIISKVTKNIQCIQLETGLKEANSILLQTLNSYEVKNNERISTLNLGRTGGLCDEFEKSLKTVFNGKFWNFYGSQAFYIGKGNKWIWIDRQYTTYTGKKLGEYSKTRFRDGALIISNGMLLLFENGGNWNRYSLWISVDVNGYKKGPNKLGHDLFAFEINSEGRLLPMGAQGTAYYGQDNKYCSKESNDGLNGIACTYKALYEKDYFKNLL